MLRRLDLLPSRRPHRVLPRLGGHWLGDLAADDLTIWTIQPEAVYGALVDIGEAYPDPSLAPTDLERAYDWMARQADARLPTGGPGMFWVWAVASPIVV